MVQVAAYVFPGRGGRRAGGRRWSAS